MNCLNSVFKCNACDLNFESVRLFFDSELGDKSPKTRNHYRETLRGIIDHCVARSWLTSNHRLETLLKAEKAIPADPEIISPETFRTVLEAADPEMLPAVAILGFCGIRTSEIENLKWEHVFDIEGYIEMNAHRTKTAQRRLVPRPPALDKWLEPYRDRTGLLWRGTYTAFERAYTKLRKKTGIAGKNNCMRHSYASYKLAITDNPNELASAMGNSPSIIYRNYRKLVTPYAGHQWFAVFPPRTQPNVIVAA